MKISVALRSRGPSASPALIGGVTTGVEEMAPAAAPRLSTVPTRKPSPRVSVVVPALNEAENLPHVLPRIAPEYQLVLVDGGSVDATVEVATRLRPDVRVAAMHVVVADDATHHLTRAWNRVPSLGTA